MDDEQAASSTPSRYGFRPQCLTIQPSDADASKTFKHWAFVLEQYSAAVTPQEGSPSLGLLASYLSSDNYSIIAQAVSFQDAMKSLRATFEKLPNEVVARHILTVRRQLVGKSIDDYARALQALARQCNFQPCTAIQHQNLCVRDAFIAGLSSSSYRQRLLENQVLDLDVAINQARALELAYNDSRTYLNDQVASITPAPPLSHSSSSVETRSPPISSSRQTVLNLLTKNSRLCFYCGSSPHPRSRCRARNSICNSCQKKGHFSTVCLSRQYASSSHEITSDSLFQDPTPDLARSIPYESATISPSL